MKIAEIFTEHMVLQRGITIRVFGSGDGEVTVRFLGETVTRKSEKSSSGAVWIRDVLFRTAYL